MKLGSRKKVESVAHGHSLMGIKGKNLGGRAYLVGKLMERGLSRRDAVRILNVIFREMGRALRRGEDMEFPFGRLKRVRLGRRKQRGRFLNRIKTIYQKPLTVVHTIDRVDQYLQDREEVPGRGARSRGGTRRPRGIHGDFGNG
jgi:nucleoid DNA-binding protein